MIEQDWFNWGWGRVGQYRDGNIGRDSQHLGLPKKPFENLAPENFSKINKYIKRILMELPYNEGTIPEQQQIKTPVSGIDYLLLNCWTMSPIKLQQFRAMANTLGSLYCHKCLCFMLNNMEKSSWYSAGSFTFPEQLLQCWKVHCMLQWEKRNHQSRIAVVPVMITSWTSQCHW